MNWIKKIIKSIFKLLISLIIIFVVLELLLSFYDPMQMRIANDKIVLPANKHIIINNDFNPELSEEIIHTKNSLGFRGEEMPDSFEEYLSIVSLGGSTTEAYYISDDMTWSYLLDERLENNFNKVWINNAGLDGLSSYGMNILLDDYLVDIKPKIVLMLMGSNDVGRDDLGEYDKRLYINSTKKSKVISLATNIRRVYQAKEMGLLHGGFQIMEANELFIEEDEAEKIINQHKTEYIEAYKTRVLALINTSRQNNIEPIIITQPTMMGGGIDEQTGKNLDLLEFSGMNGAVYWDVLQLYNNAAKEVANNEGVYIIDLAAEMPKSSLYFYDAIHYNNSGEAKVAEIIADNLFGYLGEQYSEFKK